MHYKPHNYQAHASHFIEEHAQAALLLDMGLGKTVITLTALSSLLFDQFLIRRVLVVAPLRVARDTWGTELTKWEHLDHLTFAVAVGTPAERTRALLQGADITIINRENLSWLMEQKRLSLSFDMIVIDELSSFKNRATKRFKAMMALRKNAKRIVGLTGTPAPNGLMDLWAEFKVLDFGERLGHFISHYRERYFVPDKRNAQVIFSYKPKPGAEDAIYRAIADITLSMKATEHLSMPELVKVNHELEMSERERRHYETLKQDLIVHLDGADISAANAAVLSGKLTQLANGAIYTDDGQVISIHDHKTDALEDLLEMACGKPVLVAYGFKHDLTRITKRLESMTLSFAKLDSSSSIKAWNEGKLQVGLIHPASAGHGLNLQAGGSTLIWFSLPWSLELYAQTNARLWRQGQTATTVVVYHLVCKGSIDERILQVLEGKGKTQDALIDAVRAELMPQQNERQTTSETRKN
ncbi:DEAD/DEAH box helicase [Alloscardovia omnicolens]|uniref:DEAD/DEAH box helicase n=1 Tax=Alloscardovia omnicolens TaxID=419015 RepID=UPI003A78DA56